MRESVFQSQLIKEIKGRFPGCFVLKNDVGNQYQGFPDLLILHNNRWAALEVKQSGSAHRQPNQEYYIDILGQMSFASFICPETKGEVLDAMEQALES